MLYYFLHFIIRVTLFIVGSFTLIATVSFWAINSLYLSPLTYGLLSPSLFFKNCLGVREFRSVASKMERRKYNLLCNMHNEINFNKNDMDYADNVIMT